MTVPRLAKGTPDIPLHRAVFLDRDGTIIKDMEFSTDPAVLEPLPGALEGLRLLQEAGYELVVITNQSGVARGYFDEESLRAFHDYMTGWFGARGIMLSGIYYCPHYVDGALSQYAIDCGCRKPQPGMILRAAADRRLDLAQSWMVGDRDADIGAGKAAGCRTIRVGDKPNDAEPAEFTAADMTEAAGIILSH